MKIGKTQHIVENIKIQALIVKKKVYKNQLQNLEKKSAVLKKSKLLTKKTKNYKKNTVKIEKKKYIELKKNSPVNSRKII